MKSPFPGMDPYLERHWRDFHGAMIASIRSALNATLPDGLAARMEERVVIDSANYGEPRAVYPDARIFEDPEAYAGEPPSPGGSTAIAEPIVLTYEVEEHTETYIEVLDFNRSEKLVTVVELLSPTNKLPGDGREQYLRKRGELVSAGIGYVEIDLVRRGSWRQLLTPLVAPARVNPAYRAIVRRGERGASTRRAEFFALPLRRRLSTIPVPLREGEADAPLDLQASVNAVYRDGRYGRSLYDEELDLPLSVSDALWASEQIGRIR